VRGSEQSIDRDSRGWGLVLRVAGALVPLLGFWISHFEAYRDWWVQAAVPDWVSTVFSVMAFLWAWPYRGFHYEPVAFGSLALLCVLFAVAMWVRRDRLGAVTVVVWCLFWGWLLATIIGQERGS
jgi:hypothetical protein